jgi:hypothetical protein
MGVPALRIYEDIICHHYYENMEGEGHIGFQGDIDESLCKGDEVQNQLNVLLGVYHFLAAISGKQSLIEKINYQLYRKLMESVQALLQQYRMDY